MSESFKRNLNFELAFERATANLAWGKTGQGGRGSSVPPCFQASRLYKFGANHAGMQVIPQNSQNVTAEQPVPHLIPHCLH